MYKPLKDVIAEIEAKHSKKPLLYDLEERSRVIADFDKNIAYLFERFDIYEEDVKFVLEHNLDVNIISRISLNLILIMQQLCESLSDYDYVIELYLMDDCYEKNRDLWSAFINARRKMNDIFAKLQENNIFEVETPDENAVLERLYYDDEVYNNDEKITATGMMQIQQEEVEKMNGAELLICLNCLFQIFEDNLWELKTSSLERWEEGMKSLYERNFVLYAKNYWPAEERNFRPHILNHRLRGKVNVNALEKLRDEAMHDFEYNSVPGRIWRDNSEDLTKLAIQMKEQKLNEEQWRYFFSWVFKLAEYDTWIEELRNPPESEEMKQKRERLLKTNKVFNLKPAKSKKEVDILLIYQYIASRFVAEKMFVYEWYALYTLFKRNDLLLSCTIEEFEKQMNDVEWFGHVTKKCSANEINIYTYLDKKAPDVWDKIERKYKSRATNKSVGNIYKKYTELYDTLEEIYINE